jgi:ketosteroid isomerase-like protein
VYGLTEYAAQTEQWFAELTERGDTIGIEFRFLERIVSVDVASERGVYRITAARAGGERRMMYGRFHTFARKTDGCWRIAVDYDSDEGGTVTEETFLAGAGIDDVAVFAG